jgi:ribosome assembly protein 4
MATVAPPPPKRQRIEAIKRTRVQVQPDDTTENANASFRARFVDDEGQQITTGEIQLLSADTSEKNLALLINTLLGREPDNFTPYRFCVHIQDKNIHLTSQSTSLSSLLKQNGITPSFETVITISAHPQAVFKVQAVSRLSHRIPGHAEPILTAQWSPAANRLATGSGDNSARIWDADTGTPLFTMKGHSGWILDVRWSPDGEQLATCSMDGTIRRWDAQTGKALGRILSGHRRWVSMVAWQPYHLWQSGEGARLASAGKDGTARIWVVNTGRTEHVLSCKDSVSCVKWGGTNLVYTASRDKSVCVWDAKLGNLLHKMTAHAHVVNHLALSTDFLLRTGFFEYSREKDIPSTEEGKRALAKERFEKAASRQGKIIELLVSASDDCIVYLWDPTNLGEKPLARLLGHQKQVNSVAFSPDMTLVASTGWDNVTKIWGARDGKFIYSLRGHVGPVYQCAFSADSRLLVTCSKDCTVKVWDLRSGKMVNDLPGHQDEVYAVDWSPTGKMVGSGGKDKALRIWS